MPLTLLILLIAFGALVAAGLPVLLALSAVLAATGLNALVEPFHPDRPADAQRDHPHDRHGGRDRLLAVLPPARARGAARGRVAARRAAPHRTNLGPGRAHLRLDGADRDGGDVHQPATRCSRRSASGTMIVVLAAMVGSLTVLPARPAPPRRQRRPRPRSRSSAAGRATTARGAASSAACCGIRSSGLSVRRWRAARRWRCRSLDAHEAAEPHRPAARPEDRADVRADPARVPGLADAGRRGRAGRRTSRRRDAAPRSRSSARRALATGELFAPVHGRR